MSTKSYRWIALAVIAWFFSGARAEAQEPAPASVVPRVELAAPANLSAGDRAEVLAYVTGAGRHPVLVTPRSEGTAIEVVRGRLMRGEARDPNAERLEFRIPIVAHAAGTAVVRVSIAAYACERQCRLVRHEASTIVRVAPASRSANDKKQSNEVRSSALSWVRLPGADGCIASAPLARAIEEQLERHVFVSAAEAALTVEGRAERTAELWRATLEVTDAAGESLGRRTLESQSAECDELGEMVAVAVAVMIDPLTAPSESNEPAPPVEPVVIVRTERVQVPVRVEVPVEVPAEPVEPTREWRVEIDAVLMGALGLVPTPMIGGITSIIVEPPNFVPIALEGALIPFSRAERSSGRSDFLHLHVGLMICPLWIREGDLALHACLGADAGAVIVVGGDQTVDETERLIGQAHLAVRGHWDVGGPVTIRLAFHFLVPFRHDPFTVGGVPIYQPDPVAGLVDLGVGVHF